MRGLVYLYAYGALFALMVLCVMFERGELIDPMPGIVMLVAGASGAGLGFLASVEAKRRGWLKSGYRATGWMAGLTLMGLAGAWIVTNSLTLRVVFAGANAGTDTALFDIVGRDRSRRKGFSTSPRYHLVTRSPGSDGTVRVRVRATKALYDRIGSNRPETGGYCVELPVKTGRWGVRAVWIPNRADAPFDLADLRPCGRTGGF